MLGHDSSLVAQECNKREWPVFLMSRGRAKEALDAALVTAAHRSRLSVQPDMSWSAKRGWLSASFR
jgi:hypothetical protein